jgi:hypothetical protein
LKNGGEGGGNAVSDGRGGKGALPRGSQVPKVAFSKTSFRNFADFKLLKRPSHQN